MNNYTKTIQTIGFLLITVVVNSQKMPCVNGMAGNYPCQNIDLLAHISAKDLIAENHLGRWINDIWGWTDPLDGREYAIVGMTNGTSFVDVTDPVNPRVLGMLPEHNFNNGGIFNNQTAVMHDDAKSIWRDIKVYNNHAYIVSEDPDHGMQVFDLTQLRGVKTSQTFTETNIYKGVGKAHNIVINEETGYAYAVGANSRDKICTEGGLHIINLQNPAQPVYEACFDQDGYTHDAQCVIYKGPDTAYKNREICFNANENTITLVDVHDKKNIKLISRKPYEGVKYAHQGWLTKDHKYFITNDERDERDLGINTHTYIWDVTDLDNPLHVATYEHNGRSIDHNLYIIDNLVYQSNYTSGLRILDANFGAVTQLAEVAYFDTYPSTNSTTFFGTWSNYPFFKSGTILVSDITGGLYILKHNLKYKNPPKVDFSFEIKEDNKVKFTNKSSEANKYLWDFGNGETSTVTNPVHKYKKKESYQVKLIATNPLGTRETVKKIEILVTATHEQNNNGAVSIYPNPAEKLLNIRFPEKIGNGQIRLHDINGRTIINNAIPLDMNDLTLDVSSLQKGMYYVSITTKDKLITKKVIIK